MLSQNADIALLTDHRYAASEASEGDWYFGNILREDWLLQEALQKHGLSSIRLDWEQPDVDWSAFRCAVFRTPWNYFERYGKFTTWLEQTEKQTRLINDSSTIWWNLDKHYLADLEQRGISVVPMRFLEAGSEMGLSQLLRETGWEEAVIKPCVSGGAWHTYRVNKDNADEIESVIRPLLEDYAFILQPFMNEIMESGEDSLMVINGEFTHAVRKIAKPGDFRVQDDHGGTYHLCTPTNEQIKLAEQAMDAIDPVPQYGRVDMVKDNDGCWSVMELELIEPELWLRLHPSAAEKLARAIAHATYQVQEPGRSV